MNTALTYRAHCLIEGRCCTCGCASFLLPVSYLHVTSCCRRNYKVIIGDVFRSRKTFCLCFRLLKFIEAFLAEGPRRIVKPTLMPQQYVMSCSNRCYWMWYYKIKCEDLTEHVRHFEKFAGHVRHDGT